MKEAFLEARGLHLVYDSVAALDGADFTCLKGEIHAVVGEHGAGKSSLAAVFAGFRRPQGGCLLVEGRSYPYLTQERALALGVEFVSQDIPLHENLSVAENIVLGPGIGVFPLTGRRRAIREAGDFVGSLGFSLDVADSLSSLKLADRALVDVLKHLYRRPRLLILDETLEKLSTENLKRLVLLLGKSVAEGLAVLFISHRIDDVYTVADRVTILRDGRRLLTEQTDDIDKLNLIRLAYTHTLPSLDRVDEETFSRVLKYNEAILRDLPVSLLVVDGDGELRMMNQAAETFLLPDAGVAYVGRKLAEVLPPGNQELLSMLDADGCVDGARAFRRVRLVAPGGTRTCNLTRYPILERSRLIGSILIFVDITEEESLRDRITLSENLASLGLLAAGVAHEINNPLDIMGYHLENLRFHNRNTDIDASLDGIEDEIQAIAQIVGQLITFSGKGPVEPETFHLDELVCDLVELLRYQARKSRIDVVLERPEPSSRAEGFLIHANKCEIRQVLLNLLRNAFEAMPNGGTALLRVLADDTRERDFCRIDVEDEGRGLSVGKLSDLFLPFFSTKSATGRNAGLGLSISYGITTRYGGTIEAENLAAGGCRFSVFLPRVRL